MLRRVEPALSFFGSLRKLSEHPCRSTAPSPNYRTAANLTIIGHSQKPIDCPFMAGPEVRRFADAAFSVALDDPPTGFHILAATAHLYQDQVG